MKWTNELIRQELKKSITVLGLNRMPTGGELKSIGRNDLHCKISRTKKYSGWAEDLGLCLKSSTTVVGRRYEDKVKTLLESKGFIVERMTTKHPYDLLVNGTVKIDVKVANPYINKKSRVHTFNLSKKYASCDIYIVVALDEYSKIERLLIIPSHLLRMSILNIGRSSKYNKYNEKFEYIKNYSEFLNSVF